jgi:phage terminase small subunit
MHHGAVAEKTESLKRLGGGRWETRDGRFSIEPQSGTWVIVDNTQTNELGLPLVRGPYPSLTAAKEVIEGARDAGPAESPLAEQLQRAKAAPKAAPAGAAGRAGKAAKPKAGEPPPTPPEPKWLSALATGDKRRAKDLIERLDKLGVADAEDVVRDDLVDDEPELARVAIGRRLAKLASELELEPAAVKRLAALFGGGRDDDLGVRWRLVDGDGRELGKVNPLD